MTFPLAFDPMWFWILFGLTIVTMLMLKCINKPLTTSAAPCGIISLQLADFEKARSILDSWDDHARLHAVVGLAFDYLFLALYGTTIALGCVWAGARFASAGCALDVAGPWLAWGAWVAAALDAIENVALCRLLSSGPTAGRTLVVRACAVPKIVLVGLGLAYVVLGLVTWLYGLLFG